MPNIYDLAAESQLSSGANHVHTLISVCVFLERNDAWKEGKILAGEDPLAILNKFCHDATTFDYLDLKGMYQAFPKSQQWKKYGFKGIKERWEKLRKAEAISNN